MPDTDAVRQKETNAGGEALEPGSPAPRLYSLTTRYTDQFLGGQNGPDLLSYDAVAALHFALTVSSSSPLAVILAQSTCSAAVVFLSKKVLSPLVRGAGPCEFTGRQRGRYGILHA
jgi:hypothetical protein